MAKCYIIGAGDFFGCPTPCDEDLVIAADGGFRALTSHGVRCDLLIGDFDSLGELPHGLEIIRHPVEKDDTDSFLCYKEGAVRGYREFEIYGCTGGSEDHTYANYALLHYASLRGHKATLYGKTTAATVLTNGEITLSGRQGARLSIFAIGGCAEGVTVKGAKYETDRIILTPEFPLGVSNSFRDCDCSITVERGSLLIMTEL